jgi:ABC-type polysaccharide transport system permease subunit
MSTNAHTKRDAKELKLPWKKDLKANWVLYALFLPVGLYFLIFNYIPMVGIVTAFQDVKISKGIFGSPWVGMQNFIDLFTGETFGQVMRNTVSMALLNLTIGFAVPIALALIMSEMKWKKYRRTVQTISYMPYFVAAVVVAQLVREFLGNSGSITQFLTMLGFPQQNWVANDSIPVFWFINLFTDIWQGAGFGTIMWMAAISNINGDLYEAAAIDGANRWQKIFKITIPGIVPMIVIFFTLRIGLVFVQGFDKILLLYMPSTYSVADVLTTYTYRMAFGSGNNCGLSAASGLFQAVVGTTLLIVSNYLSKRATEISLFYGLLDTPAVVILREVKRSRRIHAKSL